MPWDYQSFYCQFFVVLCLTEITFIPDLMIMKIQKKDKQVCDLLLLTQLVRRRELVLCVVAVDVRWEGGREGSLHFQGGPQFRMLKFDQSCGLEWINLTWVIRHNRICVQ